jgi:DNA invertase Pin-like site-specific DNA recombinase
MLIGYARISTTTQDSQSQTNSLKNSGCNENIFTDVISGISQTQQRPMFQKMLQILKKGDTIVITRLDRLARSLKELLNILHLIEQKGIYLKVLNLQIDTASPSGKMILNLLGTVAEFERELIKERTSTGLAIARQNGKYGGRPKALTIMQIKQIRELYKLKTSINDICQMYNIKRSTVYKYLKLDNALNKKSSYNTN